MFDHGRERKSVLLEHLNVNHGPVGAVREGFCVIPLS